MLIGYARVSTADQNLDIQTDALVEAGVDPEYIYAEHISGVKAKRPGLEAALKQCRPGDTLVVVKLDRLARSLAELVKIMDRLERRDVAFKSLGDAIDTTVPAGRLLFGVLGAIAQFERDLIVERTMAGLKKAREKGRRGGRKPKLTPKQTQGIKNMLNDPKLTMADIAEAFNVSESTVYRALRRDMSEEDAKEIQRVLKDRERANKIVAARRAKALREQSE